MPDLATAMKYNPRLKVMLNGGYFDLATPYFAARYEMSHLPHPGQSEAEYSVFVVQVRPHGLPHEESLKELHDNVAAFIASTCKPSQVGSLQQCSQRILGRRSRRKPP